MSTDQRGSTIDALVVVYGLLQEKPRTVPYTPKIASVFLLDKLYWLHILVNVCANQNIFTRGGGGALNIVPVMVLQLKIEGLLSMRFI